MDSGLNDFVGFRRTLSGGGHRGNSLAALGSFCCYTSLAVMSIKVVRPLVHKSAMSAGGCVDTKSSRKTKKNLERKHEKSTKSAKANRESPTDKLGKQKRDITQKLKNLMDKRKKKSRKKRWTQRRFVACLFSLFSASLAISIGTQIKVLTMLAPLITLLITLGTPFKVLTAYPTYNPTYNQSFMTMLRRPGITSREEMGDAKPLEVVGAMLGS